MKKDLFLQPKCSQLYFIHPFHHGETGPPPRSPPFVPLFHPFPHLPLPPLLCHISACLGLSYRSCLHSAAERAPYTRISPPTVLLWYYFSSLPAPASRGLISGDTATAATTRPNMHPGNRPSQLFSSVTQDLNSSPVIGRSPRPLWDCSCPRIQLHPFPVEGGWGVHCWIECHSGEETNGWWLQVVMCSWEKTVDN